MGFWIFMVISDLVVPAIMLLFGKCVFKKAPQRKFNIAFGYRTNMSMKNQGYLGVSLINYIGKTMVLCRLDPDARFDHSDAFSLSEKTENTVGTLGAVLCVIQLAVLIGSIFPTEYALKKTFDKYGRRR